MKEIRFTLEFGDSYQAAENDVVAWLMNQSPSTVCQTLAERIAGGEHRGRGSAPQPRWEIPVRLARDDLVRVVATKGSVERIGGRLGRRKGSGQFVVTLIPPASTARAEYLRARLAQIDNIASVGMPEYLAGPHERDLADDP